jgi:FAD/FMN-containing dehydrogenase
MATGYGRVVMGGSPVVKSSTGYGLPRLTTGSFGSLGMIGEVTLKLWAQPMMVATVQVGDAAAALGRPYRPLAVLETSEGSLVYLGGPEAQIAEESDRLGAVARPGLAWPEPISDPLQLELRVPAPHLETAIRWMRRLGAARWIAHHGVGIVSGGFEGFDSGGVNAAREWAESVAGALVVTAGASGSFDTWGALPSSIEIQRRIKRAFDPAGICNPAILGSGL